MKVFSTPTQGVIPVQDSSTKMLRLQIQHLETNQMGEIPQRIRNASNCANEKISHISIVHCA